MPLQDSDNFIIGRGTSSYKITYEDLKDDLNYVPPPVLNLEVGKGSISPSVDLEEGDTLTGSATVTDAENPVVVHVWELDGVEAQRGSEVTYVADAGSVRYRKEVTDDNNQSPVIGQWSDAVTVEAAIDDTVPNAEMHGLRFDKDRQTYLTSGRQPSQAWTASAWVKLTSLDPAIVIGSNGSNVIYWDGSNWRVCEAVISSSTAKLNSWQHVVATGDGTHANLWLDGVKITTGDGVSAPRTLTNTEWWIGANHTDGTVSASISLNGYLSDVYLVEQEFEEPAEVFGKFFEGKWGPLDSSDVLAKISGGSGNYDQKWSDSLTAKYDMYSPAVNGFDGSLTTSAIDWDGTNEMNSGPHELEFRPNTPIPFTSSVRVYSITNPTLNGGTIYTDTGSGYDSGVGTGLDKWVTVATGSGSLSGIKIGATDNGANLNAIEIDGRVLIDGPFNTSRVWSDSAAASNVESSNPLSNAFDGNSSTWSRTDAIESFFTITFDPPIPFTSKVEYLGFVNYAEYACEFTVNGVTQNNDSGIDINAGLIDPQDIGSSTYSTYTGSGSLSQIKVGRCDNARTYFSHLRIDGKVLVDGGSIGENGFFLPFDPEAEGVAWTATPVGDTSSIDFFDRLFDGNINTAFSWADNGGKLVFQGVPSGLIGVGYKSSSSTRTVVINKDTDNVELTLTSTGSGNPGQIYNSTFTGVINTIEGKDGGNLSNITGIAVDGKLIVDYSSIGADASGQGNNFADENFALGDRVYSSSGWSTNTTFRREPHNAFDGSVDATTCLSDTEGLGAFIQWNLPETITNIQTLEVLLPQFTTAGTWQISGTGITTVTATNDVQGPNTVYALTVPISGDLTDLRIEVIGTPASAFKAHLTGIKINGILLVDGNLADTVLDTPMKNYAVLETGKNGNLVAPSVGDITLTYGGESGKDYYYEVNGSGKIHTGGTTSLYNYNANDAYNFGQQPFVYPADSYDTSQVWSDNLSVTTNSNTILREPVSSGFDGLSETGVTFAPDPGYTDTDRLRYTFPAGGPTGLVEVFSIPGNNPSYFWEDGTNSAYTPSQWAPIGTTDQIGAYFEVFSGSATSGPNIAMLRIDGKILVDADSATVEARNNQLYQTWTQWARTALGYAVDRIAKLEQRNLQLEALVEEARTRLAALELNEISDDAVDTALITLIGNINDRLTVLEGN